MHLIIAFIQRKLNSTLCLRQHFVAVRVWSVASLCDILTFHCGEYSCLEIALHVEAVDYSNTSNTYLLSYLLTYLLTYLLHGAESFLRS